MKSLTLSQLLNPFVAESTSFYLCVLSALCGQINQRLKNQIGHFVAQWLCGRESIMQNKANL
jgi:hypothetical protein